MNEQIDLDINKKTLFYIKNKLFNLNSILYLHIFQICKSEDMGCVSSNLLNRDDEFTQLGSSALSHHIVSLTSTTYGLLNLDPPSNVSSTATTTAPNPEVINSWELMSGLDADRPESFRFCTKIKTLDNPNPQIKKQSVVFDRFEKICPPEGENKVVVYTTSLRGIRKTYEDCNAVKSALESLGIAICERDVSMDRGFREELRELMKGKIDRDLPRVFVLGRYVGGVEEVVRFVEEGWFGKVFDEMPKRKIKGVCPGCGDVRFLPCFECSGSCKVVVNEEVKGGVVVRCKQCNENGLVLCPICI